MHDGIYSKKQVTTNWVSRCFFPVICYECVCLSFSCTYVQSLRITRTLVPRHILFPMLSLWGERISKQQQRPSTHNNNTTAHLVNLYNKIQSVAKTYNTCILIHIDKYAVLKFFHFHIITFTHTMIIANEWKVHHNVIGHLKSFFSINGVKTINLLPIRCLIQNALCS